MNEHFNDIESGQSKIFGVPKSIKIISVKFVDIKKFINRLKGQKKKIL